MLEQGHFLPLRRRSTLTHDDIAFLQYTGGTTGVAKGAMLTHRNMVANVLQAAAWIGTQARLGKDVIITALPLYHIFALTGELDGVHQVRRAQRADRQSARFPGVRARS